MKKYMTALLMLVSASVFADVYHVIDKNNQNRYFTDPYRAVDFTLNEQFGGRLNVTYDPEQCRFTGSSFECYVTVVETGQGLGWFLVGVKKGQSCPLGTTENEQKECVPEQKEENKCRAIAGKVTKLSVPAGWAHLDSTGEVRDFKPSGPAPDQVCKGGCQYLLMSNEVVPGSTVYAPKINNGGYHPVFTQYTYAGTDTQCEADTDLTTPSTPPPPPEKPKEPEKPFTCPTGKCPGVVNGEQVCVPCDAGSGSGSGDGKDKDDKKDDNKADSKADPASSAGNGNGSKGQGNGNGTGNGQGSGGGSGSGSGSKSDSTGKRPGESEGDDDGPPPQYGERPELYEPKYKDGVKGVWDEKKGQLKDTKLANLAKKLMPTEKRGNCPSWTFDLNFGRGLGFGTHRLQPPCTIWPMLRAIVLVCALILARKLVFGG